jgi:hypothetical protein
MLVIDEKGDSIYECPHIYVNFKSGTGPFRFLHAELFAGNDEIDITDLKKVKVFPDKFDELKTGTFHKNRSIELDVQSAAEIDRDYSLRALFDIDDKYAFLNQGDMIEMTGIKPGPLGNRTFIEITQKYKVVGKEYFEEHAALGHKNQIKNQIGRELIESDEITVYEFDTISEWAVRDELE